MEAGPSHTSPWHQGAYLIPFPSTTHPSPLSRSPLQSRPPLLFCPLPLQRPLAVSELSSQTSAAGTSVTGRTGCLRVFGHRETELLILSLPPGPIYSSNRERAEDHHGRISRTRTHKQSLRFLGRQKAGLPTIPLLPGRRGSGSGSSSSRKRRRRREGEGAEEGPAQTSPWHQGAYLIPSLSSPWLPLQSRPPPLFCPLPLQRLKRQALAVSELSSQTSAAGYWSHRISQGLWPPGN